MGLTDLVPTRFELRRAAGGLTGFAAHPAVRALGTLLLGVAIGSVGFLGYVARVASDNNALMLEAAARQASGAVGGNEVTGAAAVGMTMLAIFSFVLGTPLGWLATYLTLTGLGRAVCAAVGEPHGDPIVGLVKRAVSMSVKTRRTRSEARDRELREGPEVIDRLVPAARFGISNAAWVVVASRRKPEWTPGTVLDCGDRWLRVGESTERALPIGLRTLYPLTEAREAEVFRRVVRYTLPAGPRVE